jgi:hypothetical protein
MPVNNDFAGEWLKVRTLEEVPAPVDQHEVGGQAFSSREADSEVGVSRTQDVIRSANQADAVDGVGRTTFSGGRPSQEKVLRVTAGSAGP